MQTLNLLYMIQASSSKAHIEERKIWWVYYKLKVHCIMSNYESSSNKHKKIHYSHTYVIYKHGGSYIAQNVLEDQNQNQQRKLTNNCTTIQISMNFSISIFISSRTIPHIIEILLNLDSDVLKLSSTL